MLNFCHISPIATLDLVEQYDTHLVLAHLIEQSEEYREFYRRLKANNDKAMIIMDNSGYEMFCEGKEMFDPEQLVDLGKSVNADYIVLPDYPGEHAEKTIEHAKQYAPKFHQSGFGTFFVPQSQCGGMKQLFDAFEWAADNPDVVDYVGVSILACPNAFGKGVYNNRLQRYTSRYLICSMIPDILHKIKSNGQKIHFLGMFDGPREIELYTFQSRFEYRGESMIDTWDSSTAIWHGLNNIKFDHSPTGLIDGKTSIPVDFFCDRPDDNRIADAKLNLAVLDRYVKLINEACAESKEMQYGR